MTIETLHIGPGPAEEECAQLGVTDLFEEANRLEVLCYRAALTACHGRPPEGATFRIERNAHDFGTYRELAVHYDPADAIAAAWAHEVENGLGRWQDADFHAPVLYHDGSRTNAFVSTDQFDAVRRVILVLERLRIDDLVSPAQAIRITNLRLAYPEQGEEADAWLRQLATET